MVRTAFSSLQFGVVVDTMSGGGVVIRLSVWTAKRRRRCRGGESAGNALFSRLDAYGTKMFSYEVARRRCRYGMGWEDKRDEGWQKNVQRSAQTSVRDRVRTTIERCGKTRDERPFRRRGAVCAVPLLRIYPSNVRVYTMRWRCRPDVLLEGGLGSSAVCRPGRGIGQVRRLHLERPLLITLNNRCLKNEQTS